MCSILPTHVNAYYPRLKPSHFVSEQIAQQVAGRGTLVELKYTNTTTKMKSSKLLILLILEMLEHQAGFLIGHLQIVELGEAAKVRMVISI